jgi:hypothetical protein
MSKTLLCSAVFAVGALLQPAFAEAPRLTLSVAAKVDSKTTREDAKPEQPKKETVTKTLEVRISPTSKAVDPGPLQVKATFLGRSITKEKITHKEVTADATLQNGQAVVKMDPVDYETASAYTKKEADGSTKKIEATGTDYRGYIIEVTNAAGEVIGKAFSSPALEDEAEREARKKK